MEKSLKSRIFVIRLFYFTTMIIYTARGSNDVSLSVGERTLERKINAIRNYDKKEFRRILARNRKKGKRLKGVYLHYTYGYKTKEPPLYNFTDILPITAIKNLKSIIDYALIDLQEKGQRYNDGFTNAMSEGADIAGTWYSLPYFLREINFEFVFE